MDQAALIELFETAIAREREASAFYLDAASRVADPSVRAILEDLAAQEKGHEELLWRMKADPTLAAGFSPPPDWKVAESVTELPELTTSLRPAEAFALAMKKEQQAAELYSGLASLCDDATARATYESLAAMELGHKRRLEALYVDVGFPEAF